MTSSFDANLGIANFQTKTSGFSKRISSISAIEMNYNLNHTSYNTAYSLSFYELAKTGDGAVTFTRLSLGTRWYPRGMSGGRLILDNDVVARLWMASPFVGMNIGISSMTIKEYNASFIDIGPRVGVEVPIGINILLIGQFVFNSSLSSSAGNSTKSVSYSGGSVTAGIVISGLDI